MMVTFVSQCQKNAISKTRKVLDSFANRIGDAVWQTVITKEGLDAVRRLLNKTASRNTAVSCHWQRSRSRSDLVWVVGNKEKFNKQGCIAVNSTKRTHKINESDNEWIYFPLIECLSILAALFHDFGKASRCFQEKLDPKSKNKRLGDPLRHEWVSILILCAYVNEEPDASWLDRLVKGEIDENALISVVKRNAAKPLSALPPIASIIGWLVLTHHRLPLNYEKESRCESAKSFASVMLKIGKDWGYENQNSDTGYKKRLDDCLRFPLGLPSQSAQWLRAVKKWAGEMLKYSALFDQAVSEGSLRLILQYARLSLMLGDHHYSSQDADPNWHTPLNLIANTYSRFGEKSNKKMIGEPKQKLDEHLVKVAKSAHNVLKILPNIETDLPSVSKINALTRKSENKFHWQDKAVDEIKIWQKMTHPTSRDQPYGFFAVNMASTGCGKTFANAKIMKSLAINNKPFRYTLALGLRSLTLQTGDEYRDKIKLGSSDLAVMIGSRVFAELHQKGKNEYESSESLSPGGDSGSESMESLLASDDYLEYNGEEPIEFNTILTDDRERKFLYAPILVCTIDHIIPATECKRGGRYILPTLRLMSSDLVIDEVDDFDSVDLIAIGRLIHLAGMLGRKVMISSATIPPDLAIGFFNTYREGWIIYASSRGLSKNIGCAWVGEHGSLVETIKNSPNALIDYHERHDTFVEKRIKKLHDEPKKRLGKIVSCSDLKDSAVIDENLKSSNLRLALHERYYQLIQNEILDLHGKHGVIEEISQKKISFGVVRVANINPCVELTKFLAEANWPVDTAIRIMPYHSRQVLLLRHEQEKHLSSVLNRKQSNKVYQDVIIRNHIKNVQEANLIFILVATPVEEVGRDHDFDWAIIEPSSYRSFIQMSGRVLRHRECQPSAPNIAIMQYNLKGLEGGVSGVAFHKPGFERSFPGEYKLKSHRLDELVELRSLVEGITAIPRIKKSILLKQNQSLVDLEHFAMQELLTRYDLFGPEDMQGWLTQYWWMTAHPQHINCFRKSNVEIQIKLKLIYSNNELRFYQQGADYCYDIDSTDTYNIKPYAISEKAASRLWLNRDYMLLLNNYADSGQGLAFEESLMKASQKYGELMISASDSVSGYLYCDAYGLWKAPRS